MSGAAGSKEVLGITPFLEELRRVTRLRAGAPVASPLDAAVKKIETNPAFALSRLLARVLEGLTYQRGEFRRAEIAAFDPETLAIVMALMTAHAAGTTTREEWVRAAELANAAQFGAGS